MTAPHFYFDSVQKLAFYLSMLAREPICADGVHYGNAEHFIVSPYFWRDYHCFPNCGGCCKAYTIDFLPHEYREFARLFSGYADLFSVRNVRFNDTVIAFYSYTDIERRKRNEKCIFLGPENGLCSIHACKPLTCRFELNKFQYFPSRGTVFLTKRLFGRGWSYRRVDGGIGALCEMAPVTPETIAIVRTRDIPLLTELGYLADRIGVSHRTWNLIDFLESTEQYDEHIEIP